MKKILSIILIFSTALMLLSGCGQKTSDTVSMYDLRQTMEAADSSLPEMLCASNSDDDPEDKFSNVSDMDYKKVDSFFISYAKEGGKADEIVVIAVKDKNDVDEAVKSLENHREDRKKLLEQYEPEQVKRIEDGVVFSKGQYAVLIICDDVSAVRSAFEKAVK